MMASHSKPANIIRHHKRLANSPDNHQANPLDNNDHNNATPQKIIGQLAQSIFMNDSTEITSFSRPYNTQQLINTPPRTQAHTATAVCGKDVQEYSTVRGHGKGNWVCW